MSVATPKPEAAKRGNQLTPPKSLGNAKDRALLHVKDEVLKAKAQARALKAEAEEHLRQGFEDVAIEIDAQAQFWGEVARIIEVGATALTPKPAAATSAPQKP